MKGLANLVRSMLKRNVEPTLDWMVVAPFVRFPFQVAGQTLYGMVDTGCVGLGVVLRNEEFKDIYGKGAVENVHQQDLQLYFDTDYGYTEGTGKVEFFDTEGDIHTFENVRIGSGSYDAGIILLGTHFLSKFDQCEFEWHGGHLYFAGIVYKK